MPISLKAARVNAGLTQREAAEKLGVCLSSLQNYETGKRYPDVPVIKKMESAYGVEYKDLVFLR